MIKLSDTEKLQIYREMIEDVVYEDNTCRKTLFLKFYKWLLQEEAKLIHDLSFNKNTDIIFSIYHYLVLNGWLSARRDFQIAACPDELYSRPEVSICMGGGCCRHLAPHFLNIMNILNQSETQTFHLVGTNYQKVKRKLPAADEIMYRIDEASFDYLHSGEEVDYHYPNHIEVLSGINNTLYDPLNFNIQRVDFYDEDEKNYVGPMDLAMGMLYDSTIPSIQKDTMLEDAFNKDISKFKRYPLSDKELIELRKQGIEICLSNMDKIREYKEKYDSTYQYIKKQAKKYTHNYMTNI